MRVGDRLLLLALAFVGLVVTTFAGWFPPPAWLGLSLAALAVAGFVVIAARVGKLRYYLALAAVVAVLLATAFLLIRVPIPFS